MSCITDATKAFLSFRTASFRTFMSVTSAALPSADAAALLAPALGIEPRVFEWAALPGVDRAALGQPLAGAAACVLARAA